VSPLPSTLSGAALPCALPGAALPYALPGAALPCAEVTPDAYLASELALAL